MTVVVDYNSLGGGTSQACVVGGSGNARSLFSTAGVRMRDVNGQPGYICQVNEKPGDSACARGPSGTQYWSLWWSTGDGTWVYSQEGVDLLDVQDGGLVAWSWTRQQPEVPATRQSTSATPSEGQSGSGRDRGGADGGAGVGSGNRIEDSRSPNESPSGSASADGSDSGAPGSDGATSDRKGDGVRTRGRETGKAGRPPEAARNGKRGRTDDQAGRGKDTPSEPSPLTDENGNVVDDDVVTSSQEDPAGLPIWVPFTVLGLLGAGGVGAALWRRRTTGAA